MRLFIGINFSEEIKDKIISIIDGFKELALSGRFVKKEHLHLTVEFLGEVDPKDIIKIKDAMDKVRVSPTLLKLSKIESFRGRKGDIYWIGLEKNKKLLTIRKQLYNELIENFKLDERSYIPHLTIGRNVKINKDSKYHIFLKDEKKFTIPLYKIDLMESRRIDRRLSYKTIYTKYL